MTYLAFHHRDLFPREFAVLRPEEDGRPKRFPIYTPGELQALMERHQGDHLYLGVLPLRPGFKRWELKGNYSKWVRLTALLFDIDHDGRPDLALTETRIATKALLKAGYFPRVLFSGKKGYHIILDFAEYRAMPETVKALLHGAYERFSKNLGLTGLDSTVAEPSRVSRLPLSLHPGSGLYCQPLHLRELALSAGEIAALAKVQRLDFTWDEGTALERNTPRVHRNLRQMEEDAKTEVKRNEARRIASIFRPPPRPQEGWLTHRKVAPLLNGVPDGHRLQAAAIIATAAKLDGHCEEEIRRLLNGFGDRCPGGTSKRWIENAVRFSRGADYLPWKWVRDLEAAGVLRQEGT